MTEAVTRRTRRFDALFRAFRGDIVAYCGWRAATASDAQDAVAEVFLTAWRRLDDVPAGDAARPWLYATARRVIANQRRSNRRRLALHERLAAEATDAAAEHVPPGPEGDLVREALGRLAQRDREVLLLAEWESLTPAEIAMVPGCPAVTARGRLHRARNRFRVAFEHVRAGAGRTEAPHEHLIRPAANRSRPLMAVVARESTDPGPR
ncbi:MAG TPA: RNA polymerase sigma factor [Actinomycetota bacterium]